MIEKFRIVFIFYILRLNMFFFCLCIDKSEYHIHMDFMYLDEYLISKKNLKKLISKDYEKNNNLN